MGLGLGQGDLSDGEGVEEELFARVDVVEAVERYPQVLRAGGRLGRGGAHNVLGDDLDGHLGWA